MRQLVVLVGCSVFLSALAGCQKPTQTTPPADGVKVIIEDGSEFPQFLAGTWKADKGGWEITFEPDGRLSSAVIPLGRVKVKPDKKTVIPLKRGGKGIYEPGEWLAQYSPANRELVVKIVIKRFRLQMGDDVLSGNLKDVIAGQVSEDGRYWLAEWFGYPEYIVDTDIYKNYRLEEGPDEDFKGNLIFTKVEGKD